MMGDDVEEMASANHKEDSQASSDIAVLEEASSDNLQAATKSLLTSKGSDDTKSSVQDFNLAMMKMEAIRVSKLAKMREMAESEAMKRLEHPDEMSHKDLMGYWQLMQDQIDAASATVNQIDQRPIIQFTSNKQELNLNLPNGKASLDNIKDAIDAIRGLDADGKTDALDDDQNDRGGDNLYDDSTESERNDQ